MPEYDNILYVVLLLQVWMDQYFHRMVKFSENNELPSRIRFMLQDCIELRNNNVSRLVIISVEMHKSCENMIL